jgi:DNA-binding protein
MVKIRLGDQEIKIDELKKDPKLAEMLFLVADAMRKITITALDNGWYQPKDLWEVVRENMCARNDISEAEFNNLREKLCSCLGLSLKEFESHEFFVHQLPYSLGQDQFLQVLWNELKEEIGKIMLKRYTKLDANSRALVKRFLEQPDADRLLQMEQEPTKQILVRMGFVEKLVSVDSRGNHTCSYQIFPFIDDLKISILSAISPAIFVGTKPVMNYVLAVITQFNEGALEVRIKARGKAISRAVDTAEVVRRRFLPNVVVKNISIGTETLQAENGSKVNVSTIEITLAKKE